MRSPHTLAEEQIRTLKTLFRGDETVAFSLLFGSAAAGRLTDESDVDIAVYFEPPILPGLGEPLQIEETSARFVNEPALQAACERTVEREVDLVVLNRAPAAVVVAAIESGVPLSEKRRDLRTRVYLAATDAADSFARFVDEYEEIRSRSRSLSETDRRRLTRILSFVTQELDGAEIYSLVDRKQYLSDPRFRREIERWLENLVNASIDIAKIVAGSEGLPLAHTYREALENLLAVNEFAPLSARLAENARVRNVLAHEYLDIRFPDVSRIAESGGGLYSRLVAATRRWMDAQESGERADEGRHSR